MWRGVRGRGGPSPGKRRPRPWGRLWGGAELQQAAPGQLQPEVPSLTEAPLSLLVAWLTLRSLFAACPAAAAAAACLAALPCLNACHPWRQVLAQGLALNLLWGAAAVKAEKDQIVAGPWVVHHPGALVPSGCGSPLAAWHSEALEQGCHSAWPACGRSA